MTDLNFQIINWYTADVEVDQSDDSDDDGEIPQQSSSDKSKYVIKLFGVDEAGKPVSATVMDFTPHFYVKVEKLWSRNEMEKLMGLIRKKMGRNASSLTDIAPIRKKDFWGFTNEKEFWFLRLRFTNHRGMKSAARTISTLTYPVAGQRKFKLYESNIEPFLRFAHLRDIKPAGWVHIAAGKYQPTTEILSSKCPLDVQVHWKNVDPLEKDAIAPLHVASFDLECMSSDGDFPVASKDYSKTATDVYNLFNDQKKKKSDDYEIKKQIVDYFTNLFDRGLVKAKYPKETKDLDDRLFERMDHVCAIIQGERSIVDEAFKDKFLDNFKKNNRSYGYGTEAEAENKRLQQLEVKIEAKPDQYLKLFNAKKKEGMTSTGLRKYMHACISNCFTEFADIRKNLDADDCMDRALKLLFGDKDGVIGILANYLNSFMPELEGDEIIQIGTTYHRYGDSEVGKKVVFTLNTCDPLEGIEVISCESEADMIMKWAELIEEDDPDIITGYNIFGFDFSYIYERSRQLGCHREFCATLTRLREVSDDRVKLGQYKEAKLSSSAMGDNLMKYIEMEGRTSIDLMKVVQREHKLDSYKLDSVANHFMKMNKHDVSPQDIFDLFKKTSKDRAIVADYCVQDCALCNKLMMKLEIIANNVGMANVCSVPFGWIFLRGQGVKIFSLVAKECKDDGFLIPVISKIEREDMTVEEMKEDDEGYEGAIVLEPKTGIYIDTPVTVLDYASLYPSSMISENISHDALVLDDEYGNLPGFEYQDITYDLYEQDGDEKKKVGEKVCRFVQPPDGKKGVIPNILVHLLKQRKATRKKIGFQKIVMKDGSEYEGAFDKASGKLADAGGNVHQLDVGEVMTSTDLYNNFQKAVLDGLQLAYKVTANSLYGQLGSKMSPLFLKQLAACTTATGRNLIMKAKEFMETEYNAYTVYGDSVAGYTPTILRVDGKIIVEKFENIAERLGGGKWIKCVEEGRQDKESCELDGVEAWTEDEWTKVHRIIRHQLAPHKKMMRVLTHTGVVDVTDDHSLLKPDKSLVSPADLKIGDCLLHHAFPVVGDMGNLTKYPSPDEARIMGIFMGDGSCGQYDCPSGKKSSWAINNSSKEILAHYQGLCESVYPEHTFKQLDTIKSSGVYKLVVVAGYYGGIVDMVQYYRDLLYDGQQKIVPNIILNAPYEVRRAFWDGFYDADGDKDDGMYIRADQKSQISALTLSMLATSLGFAVSLNTRKDKQDIYRVTLSNSKQRRNPIAIKKIYEIQYDGIVYDLTTENHHFAAGVGTLICHNTDSLFLSFPNTKTGPGLLTPKEAIQKSIDMGVEASSKFKPLLKKPHDLEFEKVFFPMILFSKKRYCANKYEFDPTKFKQNSMGIVLKRRDNANIVKYIYGGVIDIILNKHDIKESIAFLKKSLDELVAGKFPLEELVVTKTLKAHYKDPDKIAHKMLAERIKERSPGNAPQVNDRIPYVYVQIEEKSKVKVLQGERIEHPDYIREKKLKPDYAFYLTNQVMNPVLQLYALVLEQLDGYRKNEQYWEEIRKQYERESRSTKKIKEKIQDMREEEVKKLLFDPILDKLERGKTGQRQITEYFGFKT